MSTSKSPSNLSLSNVNTDQFTSPELYFQTNEETYNCYINNIKHLFDLSHRINKSIKVTQQKSNLSLNRLYTEGFDSEQIWEQIELRNEQIAGVLTNSVNILVNVGSEAILNEIKPNKKKKRNNSENINNKNNTTSSNNNNVKNINNKNNTTSNNNNNVKNINNNNNNNNNIDNINGNGIDDDDNESDHHNELMNDDNNNCINIDNHIDDTAENQFFNVEEMESFLDKEDDLALNNDEDNTSSNDSESELDNNNDVIIKPEDMKYNDFFKTPANTSNTITDTLQRKVLSTYEKDKAKLVEKISHLEELNIAEKSWQMSGEVKGTVRPENSMLEEFVDFEGHLPPPEINYETTASLEAIIKLRIKEELWDDPIRKDKTTEKAYSYSLPRPLDSEKSKKGLAEIYEEDYLAKSDPNATSDTKNTEFAKLKDHVTQKMSKLFEKLDALTNFRYTPKQLKSNTIEISNVPAISVEEVLPIAMSESTRLAPEEINAPLRKIQLTKHERSETDRKRLKRHRKRIMSQRKLFHSRKLVIRTIKSNKVVKS